MKQTQIEAPVALLLDPQLPESAKLLWMALRLEAPCSPACSTLLRAGSGLSRPTIQKGIAQLTAAGWCSTGAGDHLFAVLLGPSDPIVRMPRELLEERRVSIRAKLLYGLLQLIPGSRKATGAFTYAGLSHLWGVSRNTAKQAVRSLAQAGWLYVTQPNQLRPLQFRLDNPVAARAEAEITGMRQRLEEAHFLGEALMREYLSLIINSDDFEDDAAPGFLVNPFTDERMQLDRFYRSGHAFEFNGPQHYGPTGRFTATEAARQRGRDYMKLGICLTRGISLQVIHAEDLSLKRMEQSVCQSLPRRSLAGRELLLAFLESVSRRYRLASSRSAGQSGD